MIRKKVFLGGMLLTVFFACWIYLLYEVQQKKVQSDAFLSLSNAVVKEKQIQIKKQYGHYDEEKSPNVIAGEEKMNWCDQSYLYLEDPTRKVLDSLFKVELVECNIHALSAIRYEQEGVIVSTNSDSLFYQRASVLEPIIYRLNENPEKNIKIQGYVEILFGMIIRRTPMFAIIGGMWLLSIAGLVVFYSWRKRKSKLVDEIPPLESEVKSKPISVVVALKPEIKIEWIQLPHNLYFDEKHGELRFGETRVQLSDNPLRLFRCFIKAEQFKLLDREICIEVLGRSVKDRISKPDKSAISNVVTKLRICLEPFPFIGINPLRGTGYQLEIDDTEDAEVLF